MLHQPVSKSVFYSFWNNIILYIPSVYKDIFKAHANAVAAERKISSTTLAVGAAERASQFARKQFIEGKASAYELEQAEERWILAQREALAAQYDFVYKAGVLALYGR